MLQERNNTPSTDEVIPTCNAICSFCFLNYTDLLSENFLFRSLPKNEIGDAIRETRHQSRSYAKGEIISFAGDTYENLIIIVKGAVICEIPDFEGKVLQVGSIEAPDTIASSSLFGKHNALNYDITAKEDTKLLFINKESVLELLREKDVILKNYLDIVANNVYNLSKRLKMLGLHSIREKIAMYLLEKVNENKSNSFKMDQVDSSTKCNFIIYKIKK